MVSTYRRLQPLWRRGCARTKKTNAATVTQTNQPELRNPIWPGRKRNRGLWAKRPRERKNHVDAVWNSSGSDSEGAVQIHIAGEDKSVRATYAGLGHQLCRLGSPGPRLLCAFEAATQEEPG